MDEKKVIETTLTEYENEKLKLLKSVFDMGCAFKMLALQKEASDWELKYLNEKRDFGYAQEQIGRFIVQVDLLKKELAKKESDTARECLEQFICRLVNARLVGVNDDLYCELLELKDDLLNEKYEVNNG
jgi:hypothetical protein